MLALALSLAQCLALATPPAPAPKIVVLDVKGAAASDAAEAALLTPALTKAFATLSTGAVLSVAEARALIDSKAQNELLGCSDPRCAQELGNVLAADQVVAAVYGSFGGQKHLAVTLFDAKEARVIDRFSLSFDAKKTNVDAAAKELATRALLPTHDNGDHGLSELRTVLLINEIDGSGASTGTTPVQTCVQQMLVDADVPVKRGDVVGIAAGKDVAGKSGAAVAAGLDKANVDVLVFGTAKSSVVGKFGTRTAVRTGLTFEIVKVDTGDIIGSVTTSPQSSAVSIEEATELSAQLACKAVKPAIEAALKKRFEKGSRVTITVPVAGASKPGATIAADVIAQLQAEKGIIATATLKNLDEQAATVDVVVRAGDGVALGLALKSRFGDARVSAIGPSTVTLLPATSEKP